MIGVVDFPRLFALPKNNRVIYMLLLGNENGIILIYIEALDLNPMGICVIYYYQVHLKVQSHQLG